MVKKTVYLFILYFTVFSTYGAAKNQAHKNCKTEKGAHQCHASKKGSLHIHPSFDDLHTKSISFRIKDHDIVGNLVLYHAHVYEDYTYKDVIKGQFQLDNHADHKAHIHYQLLLKDVKGLIAKTSGHIHLPAGTKHAIPCSNIPLQIEDIQNISGYEIKFITSRHPIHL